MKKEELKEIANKLYDLEMKLKDEEDSSKIIEGMAEMQKIAETLSLNEIFMVATLLEKRMKKEN